MALSIVIAIIENVAGELLIARRQSHQTSAGKWEFPGGKVEEEEDLFTALKREIMEETNLNLHSAERVLSFPHYSPSTQLHLNVFFSKDFTGRAIGAEGQEIRWVKRSDLSLYPFPVANEKIIKWLTLALHSS